MQIYSAPNIVILHLGEDAIGRVKTLMLLADFKQELVSIHRLLPGSVLIFSEVLPRIDWSFPTTNFFDKIRRRFNKSMEKFFPLLDGFSFRHKDLEGFLPGFYLHDGHVLSEVGLDIFNLGIQEMVEMGLRRFGGP